MSLLERVIGVISLALMLACSQAQGDRRVTPSSDGSGAAPVAVELPPVDVCSPRCAPDYTAIILCDGNVVSCDSGKVCAAGACVSDPCETAKANHSAQGCEFRAVLPADYERARSRGGSCYAALVTNVWKTPISFKVNYGTRALNVPQILRRPKGQGENLTYEELPNAELPPGEVGILFLSASRPPRHEPIACPPGISPGINFDMALDATELGQSFQITTSGPVSAYDIWPYGGVASAISSATLLIPTAAWGLNYVAADAYPADPQDRQAGPFIQIVAAEDDTQVTIKPTATIVGSAKVAATAQGIPQTYALNKGQVLQFREAQSLAGSPISANKPVSVWGGTSCMQIPMSAYCCCDAAHQQLLPVNALGHEYVAVRHRTRGSASTDPAPWTLVGAVDGTLLTYDPEPPTGAPNVIGTGQVVLFEADQPFTVRSQDISHPFYLSGHMTSAGATSAMGGSDEGDPEFVNTVPPAQWFGHYAFLTDSTFRNTNLVFTRKKQGAAFGEVTLDCLGTLTGWASIGKLDEYEFVRVDLRKDGVANGNCDNGAHSAQSSTPFGLTVWGMDTAVSYAYPAGMGVSIINDVVVPPK